MRSTPNLATFIGRVLIATIFLVSGLTKLGQFDATQQVLAAHGVGASGWVLAFATAIELLGGLALIFGVKARLAAGILFLYLIPVTLVFHTDFSTAGQSVEFMKNLAIMGGLIYVATFGPGEYCLIDHAPAAGLMSSAGGSGDQPAREPREPTTTGEPH